MQLSSAEREPIRKQNNSTPAEAPDAVEYSNMTAYTRYELQEIARSELISDWAKVRRKYDGFSIFASV